MTSTGKWSSQCVYRKMVESGRVLGKGRFRASIEKLSQRVPEKGRISVSTEKMEECGRVPDKSRIRTSIEKLSRRVPEKGQSL